jgi:uncharacterized membrane protein
MRRLIPLLFLAALVAWPMVGFAAEPVPSFLSEIQINADASADIRETLTVSFSDFRHGIFRTIPYRYTDDKGSTILVPITVQSVLRNGQPEPFSIEKEEGSVKVKIGDPDATVTGAQEYRIVYRVEAVVNFLTENDEFYWNVSGNDWEWSWSSVKAIIVPPSGTTLSLQNVRCYTGLAGSTANECTSVAQSDGVALSTAGEALTVVAQFPKGAITKPVNYDAIRNSALPFHERWAWLIVSLNAAIALFGIVGLVLWWQRHGRDPKGKAVTIAQYDPPENASPGEIGVIVDERADMKDVSSSIVNLAVNGYLIIHEKEEKKILGTKKSFSFERTAKEVAAKLPAHERVLLEGLFGSEKTVELSALQTKFIPTLKKVKTGLYEQVTDRGWFGTNPEKVRLRYFGVAIAAFALSMFTAGFLWGISILAAAMFLFSWILPKRTPQGVEALWHARGFKLFLETAEKYRLKWQEKENIFEQYLPYAMVFGVADKWAKVFADLGIAQRQPSWYDGGSLNTFSTIALWSSLNSATNSIATSLAARPGGAASGGSGFSGGFSGGGFGGGGGGSW